LKKLHRNNEQSASDLQRSKKPSNTEETTIENGQSRRRFLKLAGSATVLGAGLAAFPLTAGTLLAEASDFVVEGGFPGSGTFLSPVRAVRQTYHAVGSYWEVNDGDAARGKTGPAHQSGRN